MLIDAEQAFAQQSEHALIERVKSGDQAAYATLYELHVKRVYSLCLRLLADKEHAEDATQEVFVQLWHKKSRTLMDAHNFRLGYTVLQAILRLATFANIKAGFKK